MDADTDNTYRIDTDQVYVGGISAGAITSLVVGLVDESDINTPFLQNLFDINGGLGGNTGSELNQSYSHTVNGIINMSGAVYDLNFIDVGDPAIFSVHGDNDEVVPFGTDFVRIFGIDLIWMHGSNTIFDYSQELGLQQEFIPVAGGGHVDIYTDAQFESQREEFLRQGFLFLKSEICQ